MEDVGGLSLKCTDAPRTTKSMHIVSQDLGLEHLWVVYPGDREYPLGDAISALPLKNIIKLYKGLGTVRQIPLGKNAFFPSSLKTSLSKKLNVVQLSGAFSDQLCMV